MFFFFFFLSPFVAESASVGQHRETGKVIAETGGRLPDSGGNRYVFRFGIELEKSRVGWFKIVARMSERRQIVSLVCVVGGYVCGV